MYTVIRIVLNHSTTNDGINDKTCTQLKAHLIDVRLTQNSLQGAWHRQYNFHGDTTTKNAHFVQGDLGAKKIQILCMTA